MKEIKSVRVRIKDGTTYDNLTGLSDYKVTLYDNGRKKFKVGAGQRGGIGLFAEYKREGKFENFSDDDFIIDGINVLITKQNDNKKFEIIQDPWLENPPKWRSFGFTPYYLNNGARVTIEWLDGTTAAGGRKWSDDNGSELRISKSGDDNKSFINKTVTIWAPGSYVGQNKRLKTTSLGIESVTDKQGNALPFTDELKYSGLMLDKDILSDVIYRWNSQVPNYNLSLCDPDYIECEIIPYVSPVEEPKEDSGVSSDNIESNTTDKLDLKVVIPQNLELKTKESIPSLKIYIGEVPLDGGDFNFGDYDEDLSLLGEEFTEAEFSGFEETSQFESQEYDSESDRIQAEQQSEKLSVESYIPSGKHKLDLIPGVYKGNPIKGKPIEVRLCQIHGKPINVKLAEALLDMIDAAKKDGVTIKVTSGFRPAYYPNLSAKSSNGVTVAAQSQEDLYNQNCKGGKCQPATAKAGTSKHGSGIAVDFNTGSRGKSFKPLNTSVYTWLVKNSWKYGFVRTVSSEEWHYEYYPELSKKGPYAQLPKSNQLFYADLGLNNLQIA